MRGINRVSFGGNVGQDPELRYAKSGTAVTNLRVCSNAKEKRGDEYIDAPTWMTVSVFGKAAEFVGEHIKKGARVYIEGRLREREWEDKSGAKRRDVEIVADRIDALDRKDDKGGGKPNGRGPAPDDDEDPPF